MNFQRLKKSSKACAGISSSGGTRLSKLDRSIPTLRTVFITTGVAGAALDAGIAADYLFAGGLLLHFAIWFENWWHAVGAHRNMR